MANALGWLLGRHASRQTPQESSAGDAPPVDIDALPLEGALATGSLPAAIYHQLMFAPNEITPAWLTPRPSPAPVAASSTISVAEIEASEAGEASPGHCLDEHDSAEGEARREDIKGLPIADPRPRTRRRPPLSPLEHKLSR